MLNEYDMEVLWSLGYSPDGKGDVLVGDVMVRAKFKVVHMDHERKLVVIMGGIPIHADLIGMEELERGSTGFYYPYIKNGNWDKNG